MVDFSILKTRAPYHIIAYGTLLGTEFFQSFVGGVVAYKALPRPMFAQLQQKLFPVYFSLQTLFPAVLAFTYPGHTALSGSTITSASLSIPSGLAGVMHTSNRWSVLAPLAIIFVTSVANLVVVGPSTTEIMRERKRQETRDGKKSYDPAPHSAEMEGLNRRFATMHGVSSLLNLSGWIATMAYGVILAARLN